MKEEENQTQEYDEILLNFKEKGRENGISETSTEIISMAIEFILDFDKKSYKANHNLFQRFPIDNHMQLEKLTKFS